MLRECLISRLRSACQGTERSGVVERSEQYLDKRSGTTRRQFTKPSRANSLSASLPHAFWSGFHNGSFGDQVCQSSLLTQTIIYSALILLA